MERRKLLFGGLCFSVGSATVAKGHEPKAEIREEDRSVAKQVILQDADGEHLVRRAGPMGGLPFTIKLDEKGVVQKACSYSPRCWRRAK